MIPCEKCRYCAQNDGYAEPPPPAHRQHRHTIRPPNADSPSPPPPPLRPTLPHHHPTPSYLRFRYSRRLSSSNRGICAPPRSCLLHSQLPARNEIAPGRRLNSTSYLLAFDELKVEDCAKEAIRDIVGSMGGT